MADHMPSPKDRSSAILDSIRTVFIEKGFDGASMQDLARGAGVSVGNFYRYFPSKAAMVEALITRDLQEVEAQFAQILAAPDPATLLRAALHHRIAVECGACGEDAPLWAEITAAALRKPEIAAITRHMEAQIMRYLASVFALTLGISAADAAARFAPHVRLIMMLIKGSGTRLRQDALAEDRLTALVLQTLDRLLDDIFNQELKG